MSPPILACSPELVCGEAMPLLYSIPFPCAVYVHRHRHSAVIYLAISGAFVSEAFYTIVLPATSATLCRSRHWTHIAHSYIAMHYRKVQTHPNEIMQGGGKKLACEGLALLVSSFVAAAAARIGLLPCTCVLHVSATLSETTT